MDGKPIEESQQQTADKPSESQVEESAAVVDQAPAEAARPAEVGSEPTGNGEVKETQEGNSTGTEPKGPEEPASSSAPVPAPEAAAAAAAPPPPEGPPPASAPANAVEQPQNDVADQQQQKDNGEEPEIIALPMPERQLEHRRRIVVKHSILGNKIASHDPNVLVESTTFTSVGKIQPFLITVSTNAALVMDYHTHLTSSEVVGYLAGTWDVNTHTVTVNQAFPCRCRLGDYESAPQIEADIRKAIAATGLNLIGWYHSHPTAPPTPSIRDVEMQLDFELKMKGANDSTYLPCVGFICSPYNLDNPTFESNIISYWVVPPPENKIHEYGKPMMMTYTPSQDQSISQEILLELKKCADFYKPEKDYIKFSETIKGSVTFLEKMKVSVTPKFPLNHQKSDALWTYLRAITDATCQTPESDILKQAADIASMPSATPPPPPPPPDKPKFNIPTIPTPPLSSLGLKTGPTTPTTTPPLLPVTTPYHKSLPRTKTIGKRSSTVTTGVGAAAAAAAAAAATAASPRDNKNLASLSNYFVGSDLAALFAAGKFPGMNLDPATKSLLNLNSLSLGGMFLPPMAAAAAAAAASYKGDPTVGLMKPPPPPSGGYYPYSTSSSPSSSTSSVSAAAAASSRGSVSNRTVSGATSPSSLSSPSSPSSSPRSHGRSSIPSASTSRDMPPPNKVPKLDVHQMANFFIPSNLGKNCTITSRSSGSSGSSSSTTTTNK